jgi:type II secretory pathway component PulC
MIIYIKLTRMNKVHLLLLLISLQIASYAKPIYDFKTSYVTQLTNFNFKDQVTKIRQNTNYVAVVQFYKYNGKTASI